MDSQDSQKNVNQLLSQNIPYPPSPYGWYPPVMEEEVSLLDYWRVLKKRKKTIFLITIIFTLLGILSCFVMSKKYQAEATLMPPTQSGGGAFSALAAQASAVPGVGDMVASLGGGGQKSTQLVSFLKSRTLTEQVIEKLHLMPILFKNQWNAQTQSWMADRRGNIPTMEDAVGLMKKKILKVTDDKKSGFIKIQVTMKDPVIATAVANRMLIELQDFIEKNSFTSAKRNRIFIEEQLRENKIQMLEAGKKLNQFYGLNRISSIQPQLNVDIGKILNTPQSLEEIRLSLAEMEQEKSNMKEKVEEAEKTGIVKNVPSQVYLQYMTLQRELLGRINALLTQQYEMAKIEEAKEDLSFQVIDKAVIPEHPSSPVPILNVSIAFIAGFFFSIFYVFFLEYVEKVKNSELAKK